MLVGPLSLGGSFPGANERKGGVDAAQHEHTLFHLNLATGDRLQPPFARIDSARFQRAPKGAEESSGSSRHQIVYRCGVGIGHIALNAVVASDRAVGAKRDRRALGGQVGQPQWPANPLEMNL